jgi:putative ABC transport system permease protein
VLNKDIMPLFKFPVYFAFIPFLFALIIGFIAGIYPALVLSALKSIDSLKGKLSSVKDNVLFRKTLVAFQFTTATIVFIGALIVSQQVSLFFSDNLGYNKNYVVYAQVLRDWNHAGVQKMEAARSQLAKLPQISDVTLSFDIPNGNVGGISPVYRQGANSAQAINSLELVADNHYATVFDIPLLSGTFFNPLYTVADSSRVVINLAEAKALGWKDPNDAIGKKIILEGMPFIVCGVTADFHFGSMRAQILPITFTNVNYNTAGRFLIFKMNGGDMQKNLSALQHKWAKVLPGIPFEYHFMDDALKKVYTSELQLKKAAFIATILAIIIVLIGIVGLITLSIQKRQKEIGIRKVLGSSALGITRLFLKDFLGVIFIASLIAVPLAYLLMHRWLNDYAYRINISFSPFIISIGLLTLVTVSLIILQTIKAAFANPMKSLRSE